MAMNLSTTLRYITTVPNLPSLISAYSDRK
jgi:hypothetical protein